MVSTDQQYASSPGPGQGILSMTEHGWPVHDHVQLSRDEGRVADASARAAQALCRAHAAAAPHVGHGPDQVPHPWAFGLELALSQAANLVPADRHQALFDTPTGHGVSVVVDQVPLDRRATPVVDVERLVREAEQALCEFPIWQYPPGTAELVGMVLDLLVDLTGGSMTSSMTGSTTGLTTGWRGRPG